MINNTTAIIEIAQAVGITLEQNSMDPMNNTSYGVGQLIEAAAEHGAKNDLYWFRW
jgi:Glycerate kinase